MDYRDKTIEDQALLLDGNTFTGCTFLRCRLTFSGVAPFKAVACSFGYCQWGFAGPAALTIDFLRVMYQMEGMRETIEQTFAQIRGESTR